MFCAKCGNQIQENMAFCTNCGWKVSEEMTSSVQRATDMQGASSSVNVQETSVSSKGVSKNRIGLWVTIIVVLVLAVAVVGFLVYWNSDEQMGMEFGYRPDKL